MLKTVTEDGGTATRAQVVAYSVAGKTGTVHKAGVGGYADDRYMAVFAGVAPASNPRIVTVVMIDEPNLDKYHGGEAAAPVFARVVTDALRILNVAPDKMLPANNLVKSGNRQSLKSKKSQSLVEGRESA